MKEKRAKMKDVKYYKSYENYTTYTTYNSYITYQFSAQMLFSPENLLSFNLQNSNLNLPL